MHADDLGAGTVGRHRLNGSRGDTAMTDRGELAPQARSSVELHTYVGYRRRHERSHRLRIDCGTNFVAAAPDCVQSFGGGMQVGEDLHWVVEVYRDTKSPDSQRLAIPRRFGGWQLERHPHQQRTVGHLIVSLQPG